MNSWMEIVVRSLQNAGLVAFILDAFVKSLVILVVAAGVCLAWRRGAASARHLLWFLALVGCLFVPAVSRMLPVSPRPLWALQAHSGSGNEATLTFEFAPFPADAASFTEGPGVLTTDTASNPARRSAGQRLVTRFRVGWAASAVAVWLGGAMLILLWLASGCFRLTLIRRRAQTPADQGWQTLLGLLCEQLRIKRGVVLLQSAEQVMPVTWGWYRPVVLLPAGAESWSPQRRRVVLLHELAHVKRWDCLTQMIGRFASAVYWFNPLVWVAARQMCIERERACDDLVLNGGCKASDYASHLVEIAGAFRPVCQVAGIAIARSSRLEGRIEAIVDGSRARRGPPALPLILGSVAVFGLVAAVAAQQSENDSSKPWYDGRLRAFFSEKAAQARHLAAGQSVAREVWPYFEAGSRGDWKTATNLWVKMRQRAHQYEGTTPDESLNACWSPVLETDLAWEQFANWKEKYVLAYGNDIINSIPPGSIYFGGTDPGRGVITAMCKSQVQGDPFFTLTQNALADGTYLDYLRAMYGSKIYTPTAEDSKQCFEVYLADAQRRLQEHKLNPGEDVRMKDGKVSVSGQVSVMSINGLLTRVIFDHNTNREFYAEESFPLDWMYPHLSPNGLIMKINREPLPGLPEETVQQDHEYWSRYIEPMLGNWLSYDTSVAELVKFIEKVYVKHDLAGFQGDPAFVQDLWAQKAFSKLRSSIGGVYSWRITNAKTPEEKQRMTKEADFAFRQALALCPVSPEALYRYVSLLVSSNRAEDAILLAETTLKLDPKNVQVKGLLENLRSFKNKKQ
jgi:beta-lactamase regulating signal transducer with metallopeptidase domain